jgi:hypothetical protein
VDVMIESAAGSEMDTALKQVTQIVLEVDRDLVDFYHIEWLALQEYLTERWACLQRR